MTGFEGGLTGYRPLEPTDGRASFYGKAYTARDSEGREHLVSFGHDVMMRLAPGRFIRIWDGWSMTTGRHVKAFSGLDRRGYEALPGIGEMAR